MRQRLAEVRPLSAVEQRQSVAALRQLAEEQRQLAEEQRQSVAALRQLAEEQLQLVVAPRRLAGVPQPWAGAPPFC